MSVPTRPFAILRAVWCFFYLFSAALLLVFVDQGQCMRDDRIRDLRKASVNLFYHGFDNYIQHAYPEDELKPISCVPLTRDDSEPANYGLNDVLGNYTLTLIDSLSTLAILASADDIDTGARNPLLDFQHAVESLVSLYGDSHSILGSRAHGFDINSKVQVFETVIRAVGGLLSAHLFSIGELPIRGYQPDMLRTTDDPKTYSGRTPLTPLYTHPIRWSNGFEYNGQLLRLAYDLGERLLPAFYTSTGIPYPRVNLRKGIPFYPYSPFHTFHPNVTSKLQASSRETTETCSAGAGSLVLEFTVLSRLTQDDRFEKAAKRAFWAIWERRSPIGLLGNGINAEDGNWIGTVTGIGAGIDSFYEYAFKSYVLLSQEGKNRKPNYPTRKGLSSLKQSSRFDPVKLLKPTKRHLLKANDLEDSQAFLNVWLEAHAAIKKHIYNAFRNSQVDYHHPMYMNVHRDSGAIMTLWVDSLSAFYPGLLAIAGEIEEATETMLLYSAVWSRYSALPERWVVRDGQVNAQLSWWPGRPELTESVYHLYRASKDPWYLHNGETMLLDIIQNCYTDCGWAGIHNVLTLEQSDRMESFFLGETAKYMYLLFDESHPLNNWNAPFVFSTEGHPLIIPKSSSHRSHSTPPAPNRTMPDNRAAQDMKNLTCPNVRNISSFTESVVAQRKDLFHAARMAGSENASDSDSRLRTKNTILRERQAYLQEKLSLPDDFFPQYYTSPTEEVVDVSYYPWRLPKALFPQSGVTSRLADWRVTILEFPAVDNRHRLSDLFSKTTSAQLLKRVSGDGIYALSTHKLRLRLLLEDVEFVYNAEDDSPYSWRILTINGQPLIKPEDLIFRFEDIASFQVPLFKVSRDRSLCTVSFLRKPSQDFDRQPSPNEGVTSPWKSTFDSTFQKFVSRFASSYRNIFEYMLYQFPMLTQYASSLSAGDQMSAGNNEQASLSHTGSLSFIATVAEGPGTFPLFPREDEVSTLPNDTPLPPAERVDVLLQDIYDAGTSCSGVLPLEASQEHQIILMKRGNCSFSEKMAAIPAFIRTSSSLQAVLIVDNHLQPQTIPDRAYIDDSPRVRAPAFLVQCAGSSCVNNEEEYGSLYSALANSTQVTLSQRHVVTSRGVPIRNIRITY